jgi:L-lactate dehydrogenase complex protein LldG
MSAKENILARIRDALKQGAQSATERSVAIEEYIRNRARGPQPNMEWELVPRFKERALALSSTLHELASISDVPEAVALYLREHALPLAGICWPEFKNLDWAAAGLTMEARPARGDDLVGITGCLCAIAETGTLVLTSSSETPAAASLLPETHIAVVRVPRIVRTMEDAWALLRAELGVMPRAVNLVSGPSRTADIDQFVSLGAHGPYRVHLLLLNEIAAG